MLAGATLIAFFSVTSGKTAPYAAIVADARTGEVLYATNATARLHPASLTKMLTLYIVFDAVERGEISLDTMVTITKNAASQPPSRLGLRSGQKIALRYLIRAAAIKSANDAAAAIGDALSGSQTRFAQRMNQTAKALGMKSSTFRNANGLTAAGHLSTAADMNLLGRRLFYDFPQYYNIFSRRTADAGMKSVSNTNRRFLDAYKGADGIKTGYTSAAGFNLTASAERGNKRIIATVFGGKSTADRNAKMAKLMDMGFSNAPGNATVRPPVAVDIPAAGLNLSSVSGGSSGSKTIRVSTLLANSPRPRPRPGKADPVQAKAAAVAVLAMQDSIEGAIAVATSPKPVAPPTPQPDPKTLLADATVAEEDTGIETVARAAAEPARPAKPEVSTIVALSAPPRARPKFSETGDADDLEVAASVNMPRQKPQVVTRMSTSGGRHWGVNLGRFASHSAAERALMKTMLTESATLQDGLRKVVNRSNGYDANFMGLTQEQADLACRRLQARALQCFTIGP